MKKAKVLSALMVTAMLMGAAGCSNNEAKDTKETTQETEVETTAESSEGTVVETIEANNTVVDDDPVDHEFVFEENIDPDSTVFEHGATIHGMEIVLPCTLGDLKDLGFEPYMKVYMGDLTMDYIVDGEPEFEIIVSFEDNELEVDEEDVPDLPDDMPVVAINVYGEYPQYEFNGVKNGMTEEETLSILGTPAFVFDSHEMGKVYYYVDKAGNVYAFSFVHFLNDTETPVLKMIDFGSAEKVVYF